VEEFAQSHDLVSHTDILKKGALVAQDPDNFDDLDEEFLLTPEEREHLRNETLKKWKQPKTLYLTVIVCSIGAAVQGVSLFLISHHFKRGWWL